jgi:flagellar motor switch protein FliG
MDATTNHDAGIRKAAVFAASLDWAAADALFERLGPQHAKLVRQAMLDLGEIDAGERLRVLAEFRRSGPLLPAGSSEGIELDRLQPSRLERPAEQPQSPLASMDYGPTQDCWPAAAQRPAPAESPTAPFDFLREAGDKSLAQLLDGERAPTIALVLAHLPPQRSGDLLATLLPALQADVLRRLVDLEHTDSQTLREVEQALEARLAQQFAVERRRQAGPAAARRILASCEPETRGQILDTLAAEDQELATQLGRRPPFDFDRLVELDDDALRTVLRTAQPGVLTAALLGAPPPLLNRIRQCLGPRKAKKLEARLAHPEPIRLSDVEEARRRVAALAQQLSNGEAGRSAAA